MEDNPAPEAVPSVNNTNINSSSGNTGHKFNLDKRKIIILIIITVLILVGAGSFLYLHTYLQNPSKLKAKPQNLTAEPNNAVFNLQGASFAQYNEVKSEVKPVLQPYTLKSPELSNLNAVAKAEKLQFDQNQLSALETSGFFIQLTHPTAADPDTILERRGNRSDDMVDLYGQFGGDVETWERQPENAIFVSTDFLLHIYHVLIDRSFQKTEEVNFQPALKQLTQTLYTDAVARYSTEQDPQLKDSWKRLAIFYLVPQVLLNSSFVKPADYFGTQDMLEKSAQDDKSDQNADSPANIQKQLEKYQAATPPEIYQVAKQELDLVAKSQGFGVPSPFYGSLRLGTTEDYTQYTPRSHYTRNSVLRSYFRAMIWYGRHGFEVKNPDLTRDAMLMTWQLGSAKVGNKSALEVWEQIYLPTVFFVGRSDDLTFYEYSDLIQKIYGKSAPYSSLTDTAKMQQFQDQAKKLQGPKILSDIISLDPNNLPTKDQLLQSTKGFRFMGQRFIPDSYMFSSLTQGDEKPDKETGQYLPSTPTALMIMSILGSNTADTLLNDWVAANDPKSDKVIAKVKNKLKDEVQKYDQKTWTQNIYWSWLYNLLPLFEDHGSGYPMFMRGLGWSKKSLVSALGSWTELRHDTLLYAKQSYAEMGGGAEAPTPSPVPKGYVEPNLPFLTRLIALVTMTRDGLNSRGLFVPGQKDKFDNFLDSLQFFKSIAEKELSDSVISDDDYEKLRTIISLHYPDIVWTPDGDEMTEKDARTGIVADVHTDACGRTKASGPCTGNMSVLYEATGAPSIIYVAVKDKNGTRLTRGVTYSYYEFTKPAGGNRMTDEDWQGMIYDGKSTDKIPQLPAWTNDMVKP